jgi:phosphatidylinositol glycan class P protein
MNAAYAFVGWISSIVVYVIFLIWAFTPQSILHHYGITYYPSRYYAIALPAYFLVSVATILLFYIGFNLFNTFDPSDIRTTEDMHTIRSPNEFIRIINKGGYHDSTVPDIGDIDPPFMTRRHG